MVEHPQNPTRSGDLAELWSSGAGTERLTVKWHLICDNGEFLDARAGTLRKRYAMGVCCLLENVTIAFGNGIKTVPLLVSLLTL